MAELAVVPKTVSPAPGLDWLRGPAANVDVERGLRVIHGGGRAAASTAVKTVPSPGIFRMPGIFRVLGGPLSVVFSGLAVPNDERVWVSDRTSLSVEGMKSREDVLAGLRHIEADRAPFLQAGLFATAQGFNGRINALLERLAEMGPPHRIPTGDFRPAPGEDIRQLLDRIQKEAELGFEIAIKESQLGVLVSNGEGNSAGAHILRQELEALGVAWTKIQNADADAPGRPSIVNSTKAADTASDTTGPTSGVSSMDDADDAGIHALIQKGDLSGLQYLAVERPALVGQITSFIFDSGVATADDSASAMVMDWCVWAVGHSEEFAGTVLEVLIAEVEKDNNGMGGGLEGVGLLWSVAIQHPEYADRIIEVFTKAVNSAVDDMHKENVGHMLQQLQTDLKGMGKTPIAEAGEDPAAAAAAPDTPYTSTDRERLKLALHEEVRRTFEAMVNFGTPPAVDDAVVKVMFMGAIETILGISGVKTPKKEDVERIYQEAEEEGKHPIGHCLSNCNIGPLLKVVLSNFSQADLMAGIALRYLSSLRETP